MKLNQLFERDGRIPNPLLQGEIDYDVMDDIDDIENDYHQALHHGREDSKNMSIQDRLNVSRDHMRSELAKIVDVPIKELTPFEPDYDKEHVDNIAGKNNPPSEVYKHNGKYYINDGNHRVLADLAAGKSTTKARVIDTAEVKAAAKRMWAEKI